MDRRREQALAVLAVALSVKLFPPLGEVAQRGLVIHQNLDGLAAVVKAASVKGILVADVVGNRVYAVFLLAGFGPVHESVDINPFDGDGQKAHSAVNRVTAAHIVRDHKGFIAFLIS